MNLFTHTAATLLFVVAIVFVTSLLSGCAMMGTADPDVVQNHHIMDR